jgi:hypothetical protein
VADIGSERGELRASFGRESQLALGNKPALFSAFQVRKELRLCPAPGPG